jgi:two-component system sensor histidine kinase VicK
MKLVLIMIVLIAALMTVVGAFLITGVGQFYVTEFYVQMEQTFSQDFIAQLQTVAREDGAPARLKELVMAQSDLAIDLSTRNVYILSADGAVLDSSTNDTAVTMTDNILTAMSGDQVGQASSVLSSYMDLAVPVTGGEETYIVYIRDDKTTVNALSSEILKIILRALILGLVICVALAFLLAQIMITPIQALTRGTRQVAAGDFSQKLEVLARDEIGVLTQNFNHMSKVLQTTLSQVENERNKLSTLFLHMTDGVVAFDPTGQVIHFNPAASEMLGVELRQQTRYEDLFADVVALEALLALRRPQFIETTKTAGERELELYLAPFSSAETEGGVLVLIHDVTEQRKNEEMRREFVANVSHELRTPLTNVKSYAETLQESGDELPPELRENFLNVILSETDRMTRIVQDLLTLSRFDSGKMEMKMARFDFADAVRGVYEAVSLDAQNHGHQMTLDLPETGLTVNGDRARLEQVIMNIVSNAIKYTPDGGKIDISAGRTGREIWVRVQDNGIGIPEKDLPRLFERFYRVDKARSRESGGTGLGLSIAHEILDRHKGRMEFESQYGEGTTVTVTVPEADAFPTLLP